MGASVFVAKRGGTVVTCAATSGYMIEYDNRHLWMKLKTIKGSHFANYREAWDANQLVCEGKILPPLSAVYPLDRGRRGGLPGPQEPARGQDRRALPGPDGGSRASTTPSCGPGSGRTASPCSGGTGHERTVSGRLGAAGLFTEVDHVAIAVRDLDAAVAWYEEVFGARVVHREVVESDGVEEALLEVADSYVQLLTPTSETSTVAKFLAQRGEGLHHVGLPGRRLRDGARRRPTTPGCARSTRRRGPARGAPPSRSRTRRRPSGR